MLRFSFCQWVSAFAVGTAVMVSVGDSTCVAGDDGQVAEAELVDSLGDPLPQGARMRFGTLRFRHPSSVMDLALSPDEETVVTIGSKQLIVWDMATGKERWRITPRDLGISLPGAAYGIHALAFASDSSEFYTPGAAGQILRWNVRTGQKEIVSVKSMDTLPFVNRLFARASPEFIRSLDVTTDAGRFAIGSAKGITVIRRDGRRLFRIANEPEGAIDANGMNRDRLTFGGHYSYGLFSPDDKMLAIAMSDAPSTLRLHDAMTGEERSRISLKDKLVRFSFTPDGERIVTTQRDCSVRMYAVASGDEVWSHLIKPKNNAESYTAGIAVSPDGQTIAACAPVGSDYLIWLLSSATGEVLKRLEGHTWKPWSVTFSSDSKTLYSAGWDGPIRRWDVLAGQQLDLPRGVRASGVIAASANGATFAYVDDIGVIHVIDSTSQREIRALSQPGVKYSKVAFSSDQRFLATGGIHGDQVHVAVWHLKDGIAVQQWEWPKGADPHSQIEDIRFSADGKRLAAAVFRQSSAYLWDLSNGRQVAELKHGDIYGLSFSPDSESLATVGWDKQLRIWAAGTGELMLQQEVSKLGGEGDLRMYAVKYAPTNNLIATAHLDGGVRIWDATDMSLQRTFRTRGGFIYGSLCFSQDGNWLAVGCQNGEVSLWDPHTGEQMCVLGSHQSYVYDVNFGANAGQVLTGGSDGVCYLWEVSPPIGLDTQRPEERWEALGSDGHLAFQAMNSLMRNPDEALDLLARNVHPETIENETIQGWISELSAKEDATRSSARDNLLSSGSSAVEPLKLASKNAKARDPMLEYLLNQAEASQRAERRAVSLLGKINTPRAKLLLKGWASQRSPVTP